jgi:hypothetical protein
MAKTITDVNNAAEAFKSAVTEAGKRALVHPPAATVATQQYEAAVVATQKATDLINAL